MHVLANNYVISVKKRPGYNEHMIRSDNANHSVEPTHREATNQDHKELAGMSR